MTINILDKIFKFIYVCFLIFVTLFAVYMMTVLIISPKNDLKNRGFITCTKQLVLNLGECESGQLVCVFKVFYNDTVCNSKVIADGFAKWIKGEQSAPWSNYIFEPQWQEQSENPYLSNPTEDMKNMAMEREFMLQKQQELENIKNKALNVNENVIISDPEAEISPKINKKTNNEVFEDLEQNIDDEAKIGEINQGSKKKKTEKLPAPKLKSNSEKIADIAKKEVLK